jgi:hypothetical protein
MDHSPHVKIQMGEEKPEEELMGKRKSSPRLDSRYCCHFLFLPDFLVLYLPLYFEKSFVMLFSFHSICDRMKKTTSKGVIKCES